MLTCQFQVPSTFPRGDRGPTTKGLYRALLLYLQSMRPGYEDLLVTQMEVEEVNPSQKLTTPMLLNTKGLSTPNTTFVRSPGTAEVVGYNPTPVVSKGTQEDWEDVV